MDKIYSRPRIIVSKINRNQKFIIIKRKSFTIIMTVIIAIFTMYKMIEGINVIIDKQCSAQAKSIATKISNQQATNVMAKYKYEDLFNTTKDADRECIYGQCKCNNN